MTFLRLRSRFSWIYFQASCNQFYCLNGGTCVTLGDDTRVACFCTASYKGDRCEQFSSSEYYPHQNISLSFLRADTLKIDDCVSQPCLNQGVCTQGPFTYDCKCGRPYTGKRCESVSSTNGEYMTILISVETVESASSVRLESML